MSVLVLSSFTACSYEEAQMELDSWYDAAGDWSALTGYSTWGRLTAPSGNSRDFVFADINVKEVTSSTGKTVDKFGQRNNSNAGVSGIKVTEGELGEAMTGDERPDIYITSIHTYFSGSDAQRISCMLNRPENAEQVYTKLYKTEMFKMSGYNRYSLNEFLDVATKEIMSIETPLTATIDASGDPAKIRDEVKNILGDVANLGYTKPTVNPGTGGTGTGTGTGGTGTGTGTGGTGIVHKPVTNDLIGLGYVCNGFNNTTDSVAYTNEVDVVNGLSDYLTRKGFSVTVGDSSLSTGKSFYERAAESNAIKPKVNIIIFSGEVEDVVANGSFSDGSWCTLVDTRSSDFNENSSEMQFCKLFAQHVQDKGYAESRLFVSQMLQNAVNTLQSALGAPAADFATKYNSARISNLTTSTSLFCITNYFDSPTIIICFKCKSQGIQGILAKNQLTAEEVIDAATYASVALE